MEFGLIRWGIHFFSYLSPLFHLGNPQNMCTVTVNHVYNCTWLVVEALGLVYGNLIKSRGVHDPYLDRMDANHRHWSSVKVGCPLHIYLYPWCVQSDLCPIFISESWLGDLVLLSGTVAYLFCSAVLIVELMN